MNGICEQKKTVNFTCIKTILKYISKWHTLKCWKQIALKANLKGNSAHPGAWANCNTVGNDWCCQHRCTQRRMSSTDERILQ